MPRSAPMPAKAAAKDPRILYKKVENGGIAANTTAGFALATGTYIALLDHDDVLYPNALYESVKTMQSQGAELVYSDDRAFGGFETAGRIPL